MNMYCQVVACTVVRQRPTKIHNQRLVQHLILRYYFIKIAKGCIPNVANVKSRTLLPLASVNRCVGIRDSDRDRS